MHDRHHRSGAYSSSASQSSSIMVPEAGDHPVALKSPVGRIPNGHGTAFPDSTVPSKEQQEAGINALIALANAVTSSKTGPLPMNPMDYSIGIWPLPQQPTTGSRFFGTPNRPSHRRTPDGAGQPPPAGGPAPSNDRTRPQRSIRPERY
jgi:hypothetical protein